MMNWILATALLLQPADTAKPAVLNARVTPAAISLFAAPRETTPLSAAREIVPRETTPLIAAREIAPLTAPRETMQPVISRIGDDKARHFFVSYAVYTFAYAGGRAAGLDHTPSLAGAFGAVVAAGVGKEIFDAKGGSRFSGYDIIADILGGFAAYAVMKQAH
jgi:uncharacterized protein YfiM (DUF2279 family)